MVFLRVGTLSALSVLVSQCFASTVAPASWLTPQITGPKGQNKALTLTWQADETACRKAYGEKWRSGCARHLGVRGAGETGVTLEPALPGVWRWSDSHTLRFTPDGAWPTDTHFVVKTDALTHPLDTVLTQTSPSFETAPLTALKTSSRFWMDPSLSGERALSFSLDLSGAAADTAAIEKGFTLDTSLVPGLVTGKPVFVWNFDKTNLFVRIPVLRAAPADGRVVARFKGIAGETDFSDAAHPHVKPGFENTECSLSVPGMSSLYQITSAAVYPVRSAMLEREYEIVIRPSLLTRPAEFLRHLRVLALPEKLNPSAVSKTDWTRAPVIDENVLKAARTVPLNWSQDPNEPTDVIRLRAKLKPDSYVWLGLPEGFGPQKDLSLKSAWSTVAIAADPGVSLNFLQPGHMLTYSGEQQLSLHVSGADRLTWRIERFRDPFLALTAQSYHALSRVENADAFALAKEGVLPTPDKANPDGGFVHLDLKKLGFADKHAGLFQITVAAQEKNKDGGYFTTREVSKRLLITDTALIVKIDRQQKPTVFATDLRSGKALAGLQVHLLGANGVPLEQAVTDRDGRAVFASIDGYRQEKRPSAIVSRNPKNGDLAWISLQDSSNIDSVAYYAQNGKSLSDDALTGMVFTERGLYRPGETVHIGGMVKPADLKTATPTLPVKIKIFDPSGEMLLDKDIVTGKDGLFALDWKTDKALLPGRMRVNIYTGENLLADQRFDVQDFEPETMRLAARTPTPVKGWLTPEENSLDVKLNYAFGSAAAGRTVQGNLTLRAPHTLTFAGWDDYTFVNPRADAVRTRQLPVAAQTTDANGRARLTLPLPGQVRHTLYADIDLTGQAPDGSRIASDHLKVLVSPARAMLGYRLTDTAAPMHFIPSATRAGMAFALVNANLDGVAGEPLYVTRSRNDNITELTTDDRGYLHYTDTPIARTLSREQLTTDSNGLARMTLPTGAPGDYLLTVRLADGTLLAKLPYSIAGNELRTADEGLPAAHMRLKADKSQYEAGQTAELDILSPFNGFALVTLESDRLYAVKRLAVKPGHNRLSFTIPEGVLGRAWLSASLVRGPASAARYLAGYSSAVTPVIIGSASHALDIKIQAPATVASPKQIPVTLSAPAAGRLFLWAVDDGILRPTGYRTPSPKNAILADRALDVQTRQTLDTLMPEGLRLPGMKPSGGGLGAKAMASDMAANPFRRTVDAAAVWWSGLIDVGPEPKTVMMTLPEDFNGTLRLMAVGAGADKIGAATHQTVVHAPVVLSTGVPPFAAPGDVFDASVNVTTDKAITGTLTSKLSAGLAGTALKTPVKLDALGDAVYTQSVDVGAEPGARSVAFALDTPVGQYHRRGTLSVRPATLAADRVQWGRFALKTQSSLPGPAVLNLDGELLPYRAKTQLMLSAVPLPITRALMDSLNPATAYTRTDTAATALAWVALAGNVDLMTELGYTRKEVSDRLKQAVPAALAYEQKVPAYRATRPTLLSRALTLDVMLSAAQAGIPGASSTDIADAVRTLQRELNDHPVQDLAQARVHAYALAQITREGTITVETIEWLRQRMDKLGLNWQNDTTALFLAQAYNTMRMTQEARTLLGARPQWSITAQNNGPAAAFAMAADALSLPDSVPAVTRALTGVPLNSTDTLLRSAVARLLINAAQTLPDNAKIQKVDVVCKARTPGFADSTRTNRTAATLRVDAPGCTRFEIRGPVRGFYWQTLQSGFERRAPAVPVSEGMNLRKQYLDESGQPVGQVKVGDTLTVVLTVNRYRGTDDTVVITDLLPGGFELLGGENNDVTGPDLKRVIRAEDRLTLMASAGVTDTIYKYKIRATTPGAFTVPAAHARSAALPGIRARTVAGRLTVHRP